MAKKNPRRIAVLATSDGGSLILRSNPTLQEVRGFVREQNRRFAAGKPGGPDGYPAKQIISASYHEDERDLTDSVGTEINISAALKVSGVTENT